MKKKMFCLALVLMVLLATLPATVRGQSVLTVIAGMVTTAQRNPVAGVKILAKDRMGRVVGQATTDARGQYVVANLVADNYELTLDPYASRFKGETVVSGVGPQGLTVNWVVSESAMALAMATPGAGGTTPPAGAPPPAAPAWPGVLAVVAGVGVILGGVGGAGGFSSSSSRNVGSASQ